MTDKEKIRAEIERLRKSYQIMYQELDCESPKLMSVCAKRNLCQDILMFIDSLQEESVSDELQYEIANLGKRYPKVSYAKLSRIAVHIAKWQRKQIINKACEWLDGAIPDYIELKRANVDTFIDIDNKKFVEDFCKAMED